MGELMLEWVIEKLRSGGFRAARAYPGTAMPVLEEAAAAVSIDRADMRDMTMTVGIQIICPASMGGAMCECLALDAMQVLTQEGIACVQNSCVYESVARIYSVKIQAFLNMEEETPEPAVPEMELHVDTGTIERPYAVAFSAEQTLENTPLFAMGENDPVGFISEGWKWSIRLEEQIPPGCQESAQPEEPFSLYVRSDTGTDIYRSCRWTSIRRELTAAGIRRIQTGFASEKEASDG